MTVTESSLENALQGLLTAAIEDERSAAEHAEARAGFSAQITSQDPLLARQARRRADEWFLFERHNQTLGGVPIELALHGALDLDLADVEEPTLAALVSSITGVFEVTGVTLGEGVWVRDLLAFGEHPLIEPEASRGLAQGDLLVGRLFPVGDGLHRISPAAGVFRNESLKAALKADLEQARSARRGVVRLASTELERMFFGPSPAEEARRCAERARAVLIRGGLRGTEVEAIFAQLRDNPPEGGILPGRILPEGADVMGEVLARLAFESSVDLDAARKVLVALWLNLHAAAAASAAAAADEHGTLTPSPPPARQGGRTAEHDGERGRRAALEAFEQGRRDGRDLDELFAELERDLQLDADELDDVAGEEDDTAPDFPGVVGAMVEEYLWEREFAAGDRPQEDHSALRKLSAFGEPIGLFEELGQRELLSFGAVWLPQWGELEDEREALALMGAVRSFAAWVESAHELPLLVAYDAVMPPLEQSLPRIVRANRARTERAEATVGEWFVVAGVDQEFVDVESGRGGTASYRVPPALARHLQAGDLLRGAAQAGELRVYCAYPPEARELSQR